MTVKFTWNHENQTWNHENPPRTMKKQPGTSKTHKNQPGAIKPTWNLKNPTWHHVKLTQSRMVRGGYGGYKRLQGRSDDFSWQTHKRTLHHNIYHHDNHHDHHHNWFSYHRSSVCTSTFASHNVCEVNILTRCSKTLEPELQTLHTSHHFCDFDFDQPQISRGWEENGGALKNSLCSSRKDCLRRQTWD